MGGQVPWDVVPGNHDLRSGDSGIECGLQMLARFETPRSRGAFPVRIVACSISASPTACPLREHGRAGTPSDRLGANGHAVGDADVEPI